MVQDSSGQPSRKPLQLSIGSLLIWTAIVGLVVTNVMMYREVQQLSRQIATRARAETQHWPLSADEVAQQFQNRTTLGPLSVTVTDVRYSEADDAYKVVFQWKNRDTGQLWGGDVKLKGNGFREYHGLIRNVPFIRPLGYNESFTVSVTTPSPLPRGEE